MMVSANVGYMRTRQTLTTENMEKITYQDLACEFCNGKGEREVNIDGADCMCHCDFCNDTGIDFDQLKKLNQQLNDEQQRTNK